MRLMLKKQNLSFRRRVLVAGGIFFVYLVSMVMMSFKEEIRCRNDACHSILTDMAWHMEDANTQFYRYYGAWPHVVALRGTSNAAAVLMTNHEEVMKQAYRAEFKRFSTMFSLKGNMLTHGFNSGKIEQFAGKFRGRLALITQFFNVPLKEAKLADEEIDGVANSATGRLQYDSSLAHTNVLYVSNFLD